MRADACFNFPFFAVVEAHCASPSENAHAPKTHPEPTPPPPQTDAQPAVFGRVRGVRYLLDRQVSAQLPGLAGVCPRYFAAVYYH